MLVQLRSPAGVEGRSSRGSKSATNRALLVRTSAQKQDKGDQQSRITRENERNSKCAHRHIMHFLSRFSLAFTGPWPLQ